MDITQEAASAKTRDLINKGFGALERGNLDYAIDMLNSALAEEPGCLQARKYLRAAEIKKFRASPTHHLVNLVSALPQVVQIVILLQSKKNEDALAAAEKLIRKDPLNLPFVRLFGKAAETAGYPEIAVQTVAMVREFYPHDQALMNWLGELYLKTNQPKLAREIFEILAELKPSDMKVLKHLKDATALDSMSKDGWASAGPDRDAFRKMLRDEGKSIILEQGDKEVKSDQDIESLIADALQKIAKEPQNINYRRHLAYLYAGRQEFDKAIDTLEEAQSVATGRDPQVDAAIAVLRLSKLENEADRLEAAGDKAAAEAKRTEMETFRFDDLRERSNRYPNDLGLHFELGMALFARQEINDAIQQFQLAQRSPGERVRSLYHIGLCFKIKKQYDMAADQFSRAAAEIANMTDLRKEIIYELAQVYELLDDMPRAFEQYKSIYQVDLGYKDVAEKIEKGYAK